MIRPQLLTGFLALLSSVLLSAQYVIPASALSMAGNTSPFGRWNVTYHPAGLAFIDHYQLALSVGVPYRIPSYQQVGITAGYRWGKAMGMGFALEYERPHPEQQTFMATASFAHRLSRRHALGGAFHYAHAYNLLAGRKHLLLGSLSLATHYPQWGWAFSIFNIYGPWLNDNGLAPPLTVRVTAEWQTSFVTLRAGLNETWPGLPGGSVAVEAAMMPGVLVKGGWGFNPLRGGLGIEVKTATFNACFAMGYHQIMQWWPAIEVGYDR